MPCATNKQLNSASVPKLQFSVILLPDPSLKINKMPPQSIQLHGDLKAAENLIRCPQIRKSTEETTDGCTSSVKGLTYFLYLLTVFPSLIILVLICSLNFNQFALNHATVTVKLLMRCLITLSVQDELQMQDECMQSSWKCFYLYFLTDSPNCNFWYLHWAEPWHGIP